MTELMRQIENILRSPAIDFVYNDRTHKLSHVVVSTDPFDAGDEAVTVCGVTTWGADIVPNFDWCPECLPIPA